MAIEFTHDPDAIRTYGVYWGNRLAYGDTLDSVSFDVPAGLTKVAENVNSVEVIEACFTYPVGTVAQVRVSGGTANADYEFPLHIVTTEGDEDDVTIIIKCREQ